MDSSQTTPEQTPGEAQPAAPGDAPLDEPVAEPPAQSQPLAQPPAKPARKFGWMPAFWTIACLISLLVNIILIVILFSLGSQLFTLKKLVQGQVLGGLYQNFILMDQAHIKTTIPISTSVPAKFDLPLKTNTVVILTENTLLENAKVARLQTGGLTIVNAPATIELAAGTRLPVALDLTVPVDQMIPVNLEVAVDIPLSQTELHQPFAGLQEVIRPYYKMLEDTPNSWDEILCTTGGGLFCPQETQEP
jgi:hypothetical protein